MANTDAPAASTADRDQIVRLVFGTMAAQTLRAVVRLRVVEHRRHTAHRRRRRRRGRNRAAAHDPAAPRAHQPRPAERTHPRHLLGDRCGRTPPPAAPRFPRLVRAGVHRTGRRARLGTSGRQHPHRPARLRHRLLQPPRPKPRTFRRVQRGHEPGRVRDRRGPAAAYDISRYTTVTDVGGGDATLLAGVLAAHPHLTGVVFDTAEGLAQAPSIHWDPERDLRLRPLHHRSLQLGLSGEAAHRYADEWTVSITDITHLAHEIHRHVRAPDLDAAQRLLPQESAYPTPDGLLDRLRP